MVKKIPLNNGFNAIVDDWEYSWLSSFKWYAHKVKTVRENYYALCNIKQPDGGYTTGYMHRMITDAPKGMVVDHINGNGLDNRFNNLRIVTHLENRLNSTDLHGKKIKNNHVTRFKKLVPVSIDRLVIPHLDKIAKKNHKTRNQVIRDAIAYYLIEKHGERF